MTDSLDSGAATSTADTNSTPRRNVVIFVADGLRNGSVNPTDAPTLYKLRQEGVNFTNSHSLFPTFTTPNAAAIATGHYLGDTGDFSNTIYAGYPVPSAGKSPTPFIENDAVLADLNAQFKGNFDASDPDTFSFYNFLNEETLLQIARQNGFNTAAVGKVGPTLIQDVTQGNRGADGKVPVPDTIVIDDSTGKTGGVPLSSEITQRLIKVGLPATAPDRTNGVPSTDPLSNGFSGNNTTPGTKSANTVQQRYFTEATTEAILPYFKEQDKPFALVYWSRDPDGTQHNQGDSLDSLTPGINGPTAKAAIKNADSNLADLIQSLKDQGLYDNTDIFVTSDHGFSTISKSFTDAQGTKVNDFASSQTYAGVNPGYLPVGFVAIDIAHELGLNLYDPDALTTDGKSYTSVDATQGQRPRNGNGLIGGTGTVPSGINAPDAKVVVAANGGSDLIYVPGNDPETVKRIVDFLSKQDYTSGLFVDDALGPIPGTLPLSAINLKGSAQTPTPSIVLNFKTFATDSSNPNQSQVEIADTGLQQGQGMHGSFGRGDTFNNMVAIGPDFKRGYTDSAPVSNADVAVTLANILGLKISNNGNLVGRVIDEALANGPDSVPYTVGIKRSDTAANGQRTYLNYQQVGDTLYFDAAGFDGRTVGLNSSLNADGKSYSVDGLNGDELIYGGIGDNRLEGNSGATIFVGGKGKDTFVLSPTDGLDTIIGFNRSEGDRIELDNGLSFGQLTLTPSGSDTQISANGKLLAVAQGTNLTSSDFMAASR
jgi:arylsulfatase A-like enzyme